jgi:hypothetical protein
MQSYQNVQEYDSIDSLPGCSPNQDLNEVTAINNYRLYRNSVRKPVVYKSTVRSMDEQSIHASLQQSLHQPSFDSQVNTLKNTVRDSRNPFVPEVIAMPKIT